MPNQLKANMFSPVTVLLQLLRVVVENTLINKAISYKRVPNRRPSENEMDFRVAESNGHNRMDNLFSETRASYRVFFLTKSPPKIINSGDRSTTYVHARLRCTEHLIAHTDGAL